MDVWEYGRQHIHTPTPPHELAVLILCFGTKSLKRGKAMKLDVGSEAPDFTVKDAEGVSVTLSEFRGKFVVLYFYPRADTPGCTREACAFRDNLPHFEGINAVILGVSADTEADQAKFARKYDLPFRLLADTEHGIADGYGAWVEKNNYGKKYMGIQRMTYIIAPDGKVAKVFPKVSVDGHAEEVLAALGQLSG
jgi:peroxiredoxin Q/BCP